MGCLTRTQKWLQIVGCNMQHKLHTFVFPHPAKCGMKIRQYINFKISQSALQFAVCGLQDIRLAHRSGCRLLVAGSDLFCNSAGCGLREVFYFLIPRDADCRLQEVFYFVILLL